MANFSKEDVIKGLSCCMEEEGKCDECAYVIYAVGGSKFKGTNCDVELMKDAIEYLNVE